MTGRLRAGLALAATLLLAGCTARSPAPTFHDPDVPAGALRLVAFDTCQQALDALRGAAKAAVGPYGFNGGGLIMPLGGAERNAGPGAADDAHAPAAAQPPPDAHSNTNNHEAGVDEPDLVKTDGRRIVTVSGGVLRVVDAASRQLTGSLPLADDGGNRYQPGELLLAGDRALVLQPGGNLRGGGIIDDDRPTGAVGPRLLLVDLAGDRPKLLSTFGIEGALVDARQVGATARVVVRSWPRIPFPYDQRGTDESRVRTNQDIIDHTGIDAWLPRWTSDGQSGRVDCGAVSRPTSYSGASLLTVLTVDLRGDAIGSGDPVSFVADGDIVYGTGTSLYVANDQRWRVLPRWNGAPVTRVDARTEIYRFDLAGGGRPRFAAAGSVSGWLINQYALSEWHGDLRVATTTGDAVRGGESAVWVLRPRGRTLTELAHVGGLGRGERIYAVRFVGPIGYVVTFRQTDPLYTVDLRQPEHPKVAGELKINGYSAYLHPVGDTRLLGIGQEATDQGRVQGTQVSLFDVADPAAPKRLAQYHVQYGHSEAEFDPHAFLYWPQTGLLVVPLQVPGQPVGGATVLDVGDNSVTQVGTVTHADAPDGRYPGVIRRALVVGDTLWTVSDAGLKANDLTTLAGRAWIQFG